MPYYLPVGKITITGEFKSVGNIPEDPRTASAVQLTVTLTPSVEADESAGVYYATPHANYMYDDEVAVTVNPKHLLSTGKVVTEDKTVQIVGELVSMASSLKMFPTATPPPAKNRLPFNFTFRPSNYSQYQRVKRNLKDRDITLELEPVPTGENNSAVIPANKGREIGQNGLLFRPAIAYKVRITFGTDSGGGVALMDNSQQFILPDPIRLYEIEYPRIAFVKRVKDIGFTDGMLTDFHQTTPSPILGFLGIPRAIIKAMVPIPGG